jgi:hypothetical protein
MPTTICKAVYEGLDVDFGLGLALITELQYVFIDVFFFTYVVADLWDTEHAAPEIVQSLMQCMVYGKG